LAGVLVHRVRERLFGDGRRRDGPRWSRARGGGDRSDATGRHAADARQHSRAQDDASTSPNTRAAGASPGLRAHRRRMVGRDARSERLHHFRTKKLLCFVSAFREFGSAAAAAKRRGVGEEMKAMRKATQHVPSVNVHAPVKCAERVRHVGFTCKLGFFIRERNQKIGSPIDGAWKTPRLPSQHHHQVHVR
jgi:hypothetical protein